MVQTLLSSLKKPQDGERMTHGADCIIHFEKFGENHKMEKVWHTMQTLSSSLEKTTRWRKYGTRCRLCHLAWRKPQNGESMAHDADSVI
ncbi:hypothetical protein RRG08_065432 [Elysia crispata]|uniref:Uncharacterized protein n=1 Tax=Elysia crispata TaxID=231223 RepID=A0AAE0ZEG9_9GAST|nr:hypothetical protein RRG08_065432 [Elysia crispata]